MPFRYVDVTKKKSKQKLGHGHVFHVRMILIQTTVEMEARRKNKKFVNTLYIVWLVLCVVFYGSTSIWRGNKRRRTPSNYLRMKFMVIRAKLQPVC